MPDGEDKKSLKATARVEISPGELLDKITILQIKSERIDEPAKRLNVMIELEALEDAFSRSFTMNAELSALIAGLKQVNEQLWEIEDDIRACEKRQDFGPEFIALARAVYQTNDKRAALKRQINALCGSDLCEEKSYTEYGGAD